MEDISYINTRRIRKEKNITLKELSDTTGLSISFLSKYENGKTNITVSALFSIAHALDVPIKDLIAPEDEEDFLIVRKDDRISVTQNIKDGTKQDFLTRGSLFGMQVTVMHMPPYSSSGDLESHDGEEFLYVLEGEIVLTIENRTFTRLLQDDMAYYFARNKHGWKNPTDKTATFLAVTTYNAF